MAWSPDDAAGHTVHAKDPTAARQWAHVANGTRQRLLDQGVEPRQAEARAVRAANEVAAARRPPTHAHPGRTRPGRRP